MSLPLRIAVVGGGIAGLSLARALHLRGVQATVYEQAPALGEIGAGVLLTPNSVRLLHRLGLASDVERFGAPVGEGSRYYRADGTVVAPILTTDSSGWNAMYGMHRADLVDMLSRDLPAGSVHTGRQCTGFTQTEDAAVLHFADGTEVEVDAVVAADGIHSVLRQFVTPPSRPVHSGSIAYRGLIPAERLPWWTPRVSQLWMGAGKHFLVFPVRRGELINFVGFVPTDEQMRESWSAPGDPAVLAAEFRGWDEPVERLLAEVDLTFKWGLWDREPLSTWTRGRLTLMGDAAHPMLPHLGQGANQSVEDAVVVATMLADCDRDGVGDALCAYEAARRQRTAQIQRNARTNGNRYDSGFDDLGARDREIADSVRLRTWIYDYDAEQHALPYPSSPALA